ncbi:MAG: sigma-70 family RNA polymerase sigma factor [Acidimicrobiales bacterium]|nr:sigma-70 family RNA polymerase sigma factor [Acidimicrobiales bacterium]
MTEEQARLVTDNLALARWAARRWHRGRVARRVGLDDAEAAAVLGLVEAAIRFDPSRGVRFSTLATHYCRARIQDAAARGGAVTVPHTLPPRATRATVAARGAALAAPARLGLPAVRGTLVARGEADTEEGRRAEAAAVLAPLLRGLTPREREVLRLRAAGASLAEAGRRLGVTAGRVWQIEARALAKARRAAGVQAEGGVRWR